MNIYYILFTLLSSVMGPSLCVILLECAIKNTRIDVNTHS